MNRHKINILTCLLGALLPLSGGEVTYISQVSEPVRLETRSSFGGKMIRGTERISPVSVTADAAATLTVDGTPAAWSASSPEWSSSSVTDGWHEAALHESGEVVSASLAVVNAVNVQVHGGVLTGNETWSADSVHIVQYWVRIPEGITLTMGSGAVVKFCEGAGIQVDGTLNASDAVMTVITDDSVGGDTNMDGTATTPGYSQYQITGMELPDEWDVRFYTVPVEHTLTVENGTGGGQYVKKTAVTVRANAAPEEFVFDKWVSSDITLKEATSVEMTISMPNRDATVTATYKPILHNLTVTNGSGSGDYAKGTTVTVQAEAAEDDKVFDRWEFTGIELADPSKSELSITIPANDVSLTGTYRWQYPPIVMSYELSSGWNLISLPGKVDKRLPSESLSSLTGKVYSSDYGVIVDMKQTVEAGTALWVYSEEARTVDVTLLGVGEKGVTGVSGNSWNMAGVMGTEDVLVPADEYDSAWQWEMGRWVPADRDDNGDYRLKSGRGYMVKKAN